MTTKQMVAVAPPGNSEVWQLVSEAQALLRLANERPMGDETRGWLHNAMACATFTMASAEGTMPVARV